MLSSSGAEPTAALPREAVQALTEYRKARQAEITRLNKALIEKLQGLQKLRMQANDLKGANAVQEEIAKLREELESFDRAAAAPSAGNAVGSSREQERALACVNGVYWQGPYDAWYFRPDGTGAKVYKDNIFPITWQILPDATVKAVGGGSEIIVDFKTERKAERWTFGKPKAQVQIMERVKDAPDPQQKP